MSSQSDRAGLPQLLRELTRSLSALQRDLKAERRGRGRGLDRLLRFTADVTIPAAILVLETNIRTLRLLQRTLRMVEDSETDGDTGTTASEDVASVGRSVVDRLDEALEDVQSAVEDSNLDDRTRQHLSEARTLNQQLEDRLQEHSESEANPEASVDVEAELQSIKDEHDDTNGNGSDPEGE
ncbi:hypothetical protein [Halorhabdus sp. BNX81]|uniref:DUF7547 family protein n=1 Tax=Halorhabdus sp. BNX81 TaxID=2980181 RepID=UPI0023DD27FE|nr:hypothetical protein [Halorhabdus sp. BNX81]WEL22335.1 Uncharacterized protein HBNXHr_2289 [Halorhabdus sp. BNX81]